MLRLGYAQIKSMLKACYAYVKSIYELCVNGILWIGYTSIKNRYGAASCELERAERAAS